MKRRIGSSTIRFGRAIVFGALLISFARSAAGQTSACSVHHEDLADAALGRVATWPGLADWHRRFAGCDDGSTAEGVSEVVAKLLADDWGGLMRGAAGFQRTGSLRTFLLRHIDTAMTERQAEDVRVNATAHCGRGDQALCGEVIGEISKLLVELKGASG